MKERRILNPPTFPRLGIRYKLKWRGTVLRDFYIIPSRCRRFNRFGFEKRVGVCDVLICHVGLRSTARSRGINQHFCPPQLYRCVTSAFATKCKLRALLEGVAYFAP